MHGGKIAIESTVGKGTTVTIAFTIKPKIEIVVDNGLMATEELTLN